MQNKVEEACWEDILSQTQDGILTVDGWWFLVILGMELGTMCVGNGYILTV